MYIIMFCFDSFLLMYAGSYISGRKDFVINLYLGFKRNDIQAFISMQRQETLFTINSVLLCLPLIPKQRVIIIHVVCL